MGVDWEPRISVLLPVYNDVRYLGEAIQSILDQTFTDFELLVLDDGSTEAIKDVLSTFNDSRIRYHYFKHQGLTKTLNQGLQLCRSPYVSRQDSDDISLPKRLELQLNFLETHKDTVLVGSNCMFIDESGKVLKYSNYPTKNDDIVRYMDKLQNPFAHSSVMFCKSAIQELGQYNENFLRVQDYELWLRAIERFKVAIYKDALCKIRCRKKSISKASGPAAQRKYAILAYLMHLRRLNGISEMSESQWLTFMQEYEQWFTKNIAKNIINLWALRMEVLSLFKRGEMTLGIKKLQALIIGRIKSRKYRGAKKIVEQFPSEWLER